MNSASVTRNDLPAAPPRAGACRSRLWRALACCALLGLLAGCASPPQHYPSATAEARIGKPLFNLEMRWSIPSGLHEVHGERVATWQFNQYNYAGCSVTVRTDRRDIIEGVSWTKGCGPEPKKKALAKH